MSTNYDSKTLELREIFGGSSGLAIPPYQRSYSWEKTQVAQLWDDLEFNWDAEHDFSDIAEQYFLGTIVTIRRGIGEPDVLLDGQQRLATLTIILCAIRDRLKTLDAAASDLLQQTLIITNRGADFLTLNVEDKQYFAETILRGKTDPKATLKSHKRIDSARKLSKQRVEILLGDKDSESALTMLDKVWRAIAAKVLLVNVTVADEDDASRVFEVLNTRGVALSIADLMRNHLLARCQGDKMALATRWDGLIDDFKGGDLSSFLRHSWLSRYSDISKKTSYTKIKAGLEDKAISSEQYMSLLEKDARAYLYLTGEQPPAERNATLSDLIAGLNALRARQPLPLLLAVAEVCPSELDRALTRVNACAMRFAATGRNPNVLEGVYSKLGRAVREMGNDPSKVSAAILSELSKVTPNDETFFAGMQAYEPDTSALQRYALWEIEKVASGQIAFGEFELADPSRVHVEHIYPQNPKDIDKWSDGGDLVDRLGNMTLLSGTKNKELQNKPFVEKRSTYKQSGIKITRDLGDVETWSPEAITARQQQFAGLALGIWRSD